MCKVKCLKYCWFLFLPVLHFSCNGEGKKVTYYPTGKKKEIYSKNQDGINGKYLRYYENGELEVSSMFENGLQHGELSYYYPSGNLQKRTHFTRGVESDSVFFYRNDGSLEEVSFIDPTVEGKKFFYSFGRKNQLKAYYSSLEKPYEFKNFKLYFNGSEHHLDTISSPIQVCNHNLHLPKYWLDESKSDQSILIMDISDDLRDNITLDFIDPTINLDSLSSLFFKVDGVEKVDKVSEYGLGDIRESIETLAIAKDRIKQRAFLLNCPDNNLLIVLTASEETYYKKLAVLYYLLLVLNS